MSGTVDRLLTLARLESAETLVIDDVDIGLIAGEVVDRFRDWSAQTQHRLVLRLCEPTRFAGDGSAIREALRNLIENAVRHTPPGTEVYVEVGPAGSILVEDDGPELATEAGTLLQPFKKGSASGRAPASVWQSCAKLSNCTAANLRWVDRRVVAPSLLSPCPILILA